MTIFKQIQFQLKQSLISTARLVFLFACLMTSFSCSLIKSMAPDANTQPTERKLTIDSTAFDFTLKSSKNTNIRLNELRGNLVIINFWAAWSGTSARLLPQFETLYQKYKTQNLVVLSINIDPATANNVIQKINPEHHILFDWDKEISSLYGVETVPSIFLLDQSGKVVMALEGFDPRYHDIIENKIASLLRTE